MTTTDFHAKKEKTQRDLNVLIQTVKNNHFQEDVVERFTKQGSNIINALNAQRKHVYDVLEGFNFTDEYKHDETYNSEVAITIGEKDTKSIQNAICDSLIQMASYITSPKANELTGPGNNKLIEHKEEFDKFNDYLVKEFKELSEVIVNAHEALPEEPKEDKSTLYNGLIASWNLDGNKEVTNDINPEELKDMKPEGEIPKKVMHELTQEDFDNNPDLNNKGLNIGDEIEIDFMEDEQEAFDAKSGHAIGIPADEELNKGGATTIHQEEIEEGNKKETKTSRKNKK